MSPQFSEDALRALVRDTIARLESRSEPIEAERPGQGASHAPLIQHASHASHYQYTLPPSDGPCFIEPGVRCNHCGYCQSHGH